MTETTTGYTPTDEDVETVRDAIFGAIEGRAAHMTETGSLVVSPLPRCYASPMANAAGAAVLAIIGPIVERERRAAKVEALREAEHRLRQQFRSAAADAVQDLARRFERA